MGKKSRKDFAFHVCMQLNDLLLRFNIALFFFLMIYLIIQTMPLILQLKEKTTTTVFNIGLFVRFVNTESRL